MKKKYIVIISLISLISLCFVIKLYKTPENIIFSSSDSVMSKLGYNKTTKTDKATYFISDFSEDDSNKFIDKIEFLFGISYEEYHFSIPKYRIFLCSDYNISTSSYNVTFNPDNKDTEGIIFSLVSDGKLPAWLCIGLERFWSEKYNKGTYNYDINVSLNHLKQTGEAIPSFGDICLVPGMVKNQYRESVKDISYDFVKYVDRIDELDNLVLSYISRSDDDNKCIEELWKTYTETKKIEYVLMDDCIYKYNNNFYITTEQAEYNFDLNIGDWDTIKGYVEYMENGITYVKNRLGYNDKTMLQIQILNRRPDGNNLGYTDGVYPYKITIYTGERGILIFTHEATHAILNFMGIFLKDISLVEGLCDVINCSYSNIAEDKTYQEYFTKYLDAYINDQDKEVIIKYLKKYERFNGRVFDPDEKLDLRACMDVNAWYYFNIKNKENYIKSDFDLYLERYFEGSIHNVLNSYENCRSFVYYLLDYSSDKEFISVLKDINKFDHIYKKSVDVMIDEWLTYLNTD